MRQFLRVTSSPGGALALGIAVALAGCTSRHSDIGANTRSRPAFDSVDVGYGSVARRDLTGSVASLKVDDALHARPTSFADMIEGRFAGVDVRKLGGNSFSVRIRGVRSVNGNMEPLYVIDGVPQRIESGNVRVADLDPGDITSVEVLKDAAATSVYGSRGANGVILISTRRWH